MAEGMSVYEIYGETGPCYRTQRWDGPAMGRQAWAMWRLIKRTKEWEGGAVYSARFTKNGKLLDEVLDVEERTA
jgi:hypothetical protein